MDLTPRDKTLTLIGILLAMFLGALDQTIVATALPRIVEDLRGLERYAWVATSYLLASTVLVPVYGKLADMLPKKAIELFAVSTFLLGSFLCGLAGEFGTLPLLGDGMSQLIWFRALQGLGGAGLFSLAFIVIADLYPPRERGRYQGFVGATFGVASVLGPWIGGLLTDYGGALVPGIEGWRWVFYVNVPFGALALWFIIARMPLLPPRGVRAPLDLLSAALLVGTLVPLVLALQLDRGLHPWTGATTLALFAAAAAFLAAFVARSLRSRNPVLDLRLFEDRVFTPANVALFFLGAAFLCTIVFLPLFMVNVVGVSATRAGVSLIPLSLGAVAGSVVAGQIAARLGRYRPLMLVGVAVLVAGLSLLGSMPEDVPFWRVTLFMVVCGLGVGPGLPLYTLAIQNSVPLAKVGQATSASQFFRQIGGTVGTAVMGAVLATTLTGAFADLPAAGAGPGLEGGGAEIRSVGPEEAAAAIRGAFDDAYASLALAARSDDPAAFGAALEASPVPAVARAPLAAEAAAARGDEAATERLLAGIESRLDAEAEATVERVAGALRSGFAAAITRIFRYLVIVAALGGIATLFVPALELRSTHEPGPVGPAAH